MRRITTVSAGLIGMLLLVVVNQSWSGERKTESVRKDAPAMTQTDFMQIPFETITGDTTSLAEYKGNVLLLVNTASKCGYTPQYEGLEALYEKYKDSGLVVIGFPANNFKNQEPGTNEEILNFCRTKYDVTFPMMAKVSVKGDDIHPLFKYLTQEAGIDGEIGWNFEKFLIDRDGNLAARFETKVTPEDPKVVGKIEELL